MGPGPLVAGAGVGADGGRGRCRGRWWPGRCAGPAVAAAGVRDRYGASTRAGASGAVAGAVPLATAAPWPAIGQPAASQPRRGQWAAPLRAPPARGAAPRSALPAGR